MRILLASGSGFIGAPTASLLVERGHDVAVLHRGQTNRGLPSQVEHLLRREDAARLHWDVVIHFMLLNEADARVAIDAFGGCGRFVAISSGDVYRAYGQLLGHEAIEFPSAIALSEDAPRRARQRDHYEGQELQMRKRGSMLPAVAVADPQLSTLWRRGERDRPDMIVITMAPIRVGDFRLKSDGSGYWTGTLRLPAWSAAFGSRRSGLYVEMPSEDDDPDRSPLAARISGCRWLITNEAGALKSVLAAVRAELPEFRRSYGGGDVPEVNRLEQLYTLITPRTATFHTAHRGTRPYVGYTFDCPWDEEHGLGVMMHGLRAVKVGGADTAILEWIADGDARMKTNTKRASKPTAKASRKT